MCTVARHAVPLAKRNANLQLIAVTASWSSLTSNSVWRRAPSAISRVVAHMARPSYVPAQMHPGGDSASRAAICPTQVVLFVPHIGGFLSAQDLRVQDLLLQWVCNAKALCLYTYLNHVDMLHCEGLGGVDALHVSVIVPRQCRAVLVALMSLRRPSPRTVAVVQHVMGSGRPCAVDHCFMNAPTRSKGCPTRGRCSGGSSPGHRP